MPALGTVKYKLTSSKIEEEVDIEARIVYERAYLKFFDSYGAALLATKDLPDYIITRVETFETFVASSEGQNEYN